MLIGLVGEKLAGKDTVANYLESKYNAAHFRFTHILDAVLEDLSLPISRTNEINLGLSLRKIFGEHVLVDALQKRVEKSFATFNIVNGIRMDEFDIIKSWGAKIIYITAPVELRFQRFLTRKEKADDGTLTFEEFVAHEKSRTEERIPELGAKADFRIDNTGTLEELENKVEEIIKRYK